MTRPTPPSAGPAPSPVIGISAYRTQASWGPWRSVPVSLVPEAYVLAVLRAGGIPLAIPAVDLGSPGIGAVVSLVDGMVLTGGIDVDPARYGADSQATTDSPDPVRDGAEFALLQAALQEAVPVLAVCRGAQILNIHYGGSLIQHINEKGPFAPHRGAPGVFLKHGIRATDGRLKRIFGETSSVNSYHHQGFDRIGGSLVVTAIADDGLPEAIENPTMPFCVGVLWHPEHDPTGPNSRLFSEFVRHADKRRDPDSTLV